MTLIFSFMKFIHLHCVRRGAGMEPLCVQYLTGFQVVNTMQLVQQLKKKYISKNTYN